MSTYNFVLNTVVDLETTTSVDMIEDIDYIMTFTDNTANAAPLTAFRNFLRFQRIYDATADVNTTQFLTGDSDALAAFKASIEAAISTNDAMNTEDGQSFGDGSKIIASQAKDYLTEIAAGDGYLDPDNDTSTALSYQTLDFPEHVLSYLTSVFTGDASLTREILNFDQLATNINSKAGDVSDQVVTNLNSGSDAGDGWKLLETMMDIRADYFDELPSSEDTSSTALPFLSGDTVGIIYRVTGQGSNGGITTLGGKIANKATWLIKYNLTDV